MQWRKVTLSQFQLINDINGNNSFDELDKILYVTGVLFDKTENQLVKIGAAKCKKLIAKTEKLFKKDFPQKPFNRVGVYRINYNIDKIRFGQFIELNYFLADDVIDNAQKILASVSHYPFFKNNSATHLKRSDYFSRQSIVNCAGTLAKVVECFKELTKEYKGLFDMQENEGEEEAVENNVHPFNKSYGWIFSATEVAKHEGITLEQAYNLPVRQALNDLSFLKAKANYDKEQLTKHGKANNNQ